MKKIMDKITILIVIIIFLCTIFYLINFDKILKEQYARNFDTSLEKHNLTIEEFLSSFENAISMFAQNDMIQSVNSDPTAYYTSTLELFKNFQQAYPSTAFAYFTSKESFFDGQRIISWPDSSKDLSDMGWIPEERLWYQNAFDAEGNITWTRPYIDATTEKNILTVSKLVLNKDEVVQGVIAIDIYLEEFLNRAYYFDSFKQGNLLIAIQDKDDYFIIAQDDTLPKNQLFNSEDIAKLFENTSGSFTLNGALDNYYVSFIKNNTTGWRILGLIAEKDLTNEVKTISRHIFFGVVLILVIALGILWIIKKQMTYLLYNVTNSINTSNNPPFKEHDTSLSSNQYIFEPFLHNSDKSLHIVFEIENEKINVEKILSTKSLTVTNLSQLELSIESLTKNLLLLNDDFISHKKQRASIYNLFGRIKSFLYKNSSSLHMDNHNSKINNIKNLLENYKD